MLAVTIRCEVRFQLDRLYVQPCHVSIRAEFIIEDAIYDKTNREKLQKELIQNSNKDSNASYGIIGCIVIMHT